MAKRMTRAGKTFEEINGSWYRVRDVGGDTYIETEDGMWEKKSDVVTSTPEKSFVDNAGEFSKKMEPVLGVVPEDESANLTGLAMGTVRGGLNIVDAPAGAVRTGVLTRRPSENLKQTFGTKEGLKNIVSEGIASSQDLFDLSDEEAKQKLSDFGLQLREYYKDLESPYSKFAMGLVSDIAMSPETYVNPFAGAFKAGAKKLAAKGFTKAAKVSSGIGKGIRAAGYVADPLGQAIGAGTEALSKQWYKRGFSDLDREITEKIKGNIINGRPVSDVMWEYGAFFNDKDSIQKVADKADKVYQDVIARIRKEGKPINTEEVAQKIFKDVFQGGGAGGGQSFGRMITPWDTGFKGKDIVESQKTAFKEYKSQNPIVQARIKENKLAERAARIEKMNADKAARAQEEYAKKQAKFQKDLAAYNEKISKNPYKISSTTPPTPPVKREPIQTKVPESFSAVEPTPMRSTENVLEQWKYNKDSLPQSAWQQMTRGPVASSKDFLNKKSSMIRRKAIEQAIPPYLADEWYDAGKNAQSILAGKDIVFGTPASSIGIKDVSVSPNAAISAARTAANVGSKIINVKPLFTVAPQMYKTARKYGKYAGFDPMMTHLSREAANEYGTAANERNLPLAGYGELTPRKTYIESLTGVPPTQDQYSTPASEQEFKQDVSQQVKEVLDAHGIPVTDEYALSLVGGMVAKKASPAEISEKLNDEYDITDTGVVTGTEDVVDTRKPKAAVKWFVGEAEANKKKREPQSEGPFGKLKRTRKPNYILMTPEERKLRR